MEFEMFTSGNGCQSIFKCDSTTLHFFTMQTSACVIAACKDYQPDKYPTNSGIGKQLLAHSKWAEHGYTNALQTQVEFIYSIFEHIKLSGKLPWQIDGETIGIIVEALTAYQEYKTRICELEEKEHGKGFGSATGFYTKDWREYNSFVMCLYDEQRKLANQRA